MPEAPDAGGAPGRKDMERKSRPGRLSVDGVLGAAGSVPTGIAPPLDMCSPFTSWPPPAACMRSASQASKPLLDMFRVSFESAALVGCDSPLGGCPASLESARTSASRRLSRRRLSARWGPRVAACGDTFCGPSSCCIAPSASDRPGSDSLLALLSVSALLGAVMKLPLWLLEADPPSSDPPADCAAGAAGVASSRATALPLARSMPTGCGGTISRAAFSRSDARLRAMGGVAAGSNASPDRRGGVIWRKEPVRSGDIGPNDPDLAGLAPPLLPFLNTLAPAAAESHLRFTRGGTASALSSPVACPPDPLASAVLAGPERSASDCPDVETDSGCPGLLRHAEASAEGGRPNRRTLLPAPDGLVLTRVEPLPLLRREKERRGAGGGIGEGTGDPLPISSTNAEMRSKRSRPMIMCSTCAAMAAVGAPFASHHTLQTHHLHMSRTWTMSAVVETMLPWHEPLLTPSVVKATKYVALALR